jgi:transcriptional regulator with GAF, ATPase, and Fis domain
MDAREADAVAVKADDEECSDTSAEVTGFAGIIGRHPRMQAIFDVIRRVAPTGVTVLITGESGTGKELVAQAIHSQSRRHAQRLVPVHCGAIPEDLLESEMFGHERGAFTGAVSSRVGRFKLADSGTIFLDEVGDMSTKLQVKLLRVLENGQFEPVGGVTTQQVDVRIVAATNRNLEEAVADKQFREDLYYRLRVVPIEVPPLRARREDIPLLIEWFLNQLHTAKGLPRFTVSPEAMTILTAYQWPGNVRELKNLLEQLVVLGPAMRSSVPRTCRRSCTAAWPVTAPAAGRRRPGTSTGAASISTARWSRSRIASSPARSTSAAATRRKRRVSCSSIGPRCSRS